MVILCSGLGGGARYLLDGWIMGQTGPGFPYGTISINILGSFLISVIMAMSLSASVISPDLRLALTTGVMGGFTTYSSFNYATVSFLQQGAILLGVLNIVVTVPLCLFAGYLGLLTGRWLVGA